MAADINIKQGDTLPVYTDTLALDDGTPVNLTGASVRFVMRSQTTSAPVALTGIAAITLAAGGDVSFTFSSADTASAGMFMANWIVTFSGGQTMTFPTTGYLWVSVEENLTTVGGAQIVSLPYVRDYLNIAADDRDHDAKLTRFIHAVRPLIENITGPLLPTTFDERYDGGHPLIALRHRPSSGPGTSPVLTLNAVSEYRGPIEYTLAIVADPSRSTTYSCTLDASLGTITRRTSGGGSMAFYPGHDSIHVVYTAGQATVPENVHEAALEAIRLNYINTQPTGKSSHSVTDDLDRTRPLGFFLPRSVIEMLAPNKRFPSLA